MELVDDIRAACAEVARRARRVSIDGAGLEAYSAALPAHEGAAALDPETHWLEGDAEERAAFSLTLDAINFGSGWFPTLRKRPGLSGYFTLAMGLRERFASRGPWPAAELAEIEAVEVAEVLGQEPSHELMALFASALRELGARVEADHGGRFLGLVEAAGSAVALAERLAAWPSFADSSSYRGVTVPFFKRAQIAAADLVLAGVAGFDDLDRLTLFADNLVPHVLRMDGVLRYSPALAARIDTGDLLEHGSEEEVEIRACALHAVELIAAERADLTPHRIDFVLWNRGQETRYKAAPRHRARCTAY